MDSASAPTRSTWLASPGAGAVVAVAAIPVGAPFCQVSTAPRTRFSSLPASRAVTVT